MHISFSPLESLTKNWNVDVAAELQDYLTEIEEINFTFDGGETQLNFAEAALLIQGSACVYSKKVEYLYSLVFQTLDLIMSKRPKAYKSSLDEDGLDEDADNKYLHSPDFLLLDDIKECHNIDLPEDMPFTSGKGRRSCRDSFLNARIPSAFVVDGGMRNGGSAGVDILDKNGEVLGHRNDFRMNSSMIHSVRSVAFRWG